MTAEHGISRSQPAYPGQVDLRISANDARGRLALPSAPNTFLTDGERESLWLGPDEWLIVTAADRVRETIGHHREALRDTHHSVVDVSANRAVLDLGGDDRLAVLAQGCSIDLDPRVWRPSMCVQTLLAGIPVIIQERDAGTRVFVRPSYLSHLTAWFERVAR